MSLMKKIERISLLLETVPKILDLDICVGSSKKSFFQKRGSKSEL